VEESTLCSHNPGLVSFHDIRPEGGADPLLQPQYPPWVSAIHNMGQKLILLVEPISVNDFTRNEAL